MSADSQMILQHPRLARCIAGGWFLLFPIYVPYSLVRYGIKETWSACSTVVRVAFGDHSKLF